MSDDNVISFEAWKAKYHPQLVEAEAETAARYVASVERPTHYIREYRIAAGLSAKELSIRMGVAQNWVAQAERSQRAISVDNAMKLARILGIAFEDLFKPPVGNGAASS